MAPARQELLDLIEERAATAHPPHMVLARKLDQLRSGNVPGHVARVLYLDNMVRGTVQDQRGCANRRQNVPNIDFSIHIHNRDCSAWACRRAKIGSHTFGGMLVLGKAWRPHCDTYPLWR